MGALIFGIVVLALVLVVLHGFSKANPHNVGGRAEGDRRRRRARRRGRLWRCAAASISR